MTALTPATDCQNMAEVRAEIDRIDAALVTLLAERAGYIDRAAALKPGLAIPARVEERVTEVMALVRGHAVRHDLDPDLTESLWRYLITWSIAREEMKMSKEIPA